MNSVACRTAVLGFALVAPVLAGEPTCDLSLQGNGYIVCYEEGYQADAEATRTILDAQAVRLEAKYGGPIPSSLTVKLYTEPAYKVSAGAAFYRGGSSKTIHVLAASAPERNRDARTSSGLELDDEQLIKHVLAHEYVHAFHHARAPGSFGWGEAWFTEAFAEYESLFGVDSVRERMLPREIASVSDRGRGQIGCCQSASGGRSRVFIEDHYGGGSTILTFLSEQLGSEAIKNILLSERLSVSEAVDDQLRTRGLDLAQVFAEFPTWLDALDGELRLDYTPNVSFRSCEKRQSTTKVSVRLVNRERPSVSDGSWHSRARAGPDGDWLFSKSNTRTTGTVFSGFVYVAPNADYANLQVQFAYCGQQCTQWSNIVELSTSTCPMSEPATTQHQPVGPQPARLQCGTTAF